MSFRIDDHSWYRDEFEQIMKFLKKAESVNSDVCTMKLVRPVKKDWVDQIFHWKDYYAKKQPLNYVWKLTHVDEEKESMTFSKVCPADKPEMYLPEKRTIITEREKLNIVDQVGKGMLKVGRFVINKSGDYGQIMDFTVEEVEDKELSSDEMKKINPHKIDIMMDAVFVNYKYENNCRIESLVNPEFDGEDSMGLEKFMKEWNIINTHDDLLSFEDYTKHVEKHGELLDTQNQLFIGDQSVAEEETSNALVGTGSKEHLELIQSKMEVKRNELEIVRNSMNRSTALLKEEMERKLQQKRESLHGLMKKMESSLAIMKGEIEKIERLVVTLEIYLGVTEKIIQISRGVSAKDSDPICFRQTCYYMDEEVGNFEREGINFERIEEFDEWLIKDRNFEKLIPESKCVIIMRPRRHMKHYSDIPMVNLQMQQLDKKAYILIRNGDNIYRIWTSRIEVQSRLFPQRNELQTIMDEMDEARKRAKSAKSSWDKEDIDKELKEKEDHIFYYKRMFLMLQGIVMRTDIFAPLPEGLNILDVQTHEDKVNFIYDDELTLPDGRMGFFDWLANVNKSIRKGSRILYIQETSPSAGNLGKERFSVKWNDYKNDAGAPKLPQTGIYEVGEYKKVVRRDVKVTISMDEYQAHNEYWNKIKKQYKKDELIPLSEYDNLKYEILNVRRVNNDDTITVAVLEDNAKKSHWGGWRKDNKTEEVEIKELKISYNPGDTVYASWYRDSHERKTNITLTIKPDEDQFIINYDALLLEDIEFYINSRVERAQYLKVLPVLWNLRDQLTKEREWEKQFVEILEMQIKSNIPALTDKDIKPLIWECIEWWKNEVVTVWKRPIQKDDAKAIDMITKRVKSSLKKMYKLKIDAGFDNTKKILAFNDLSGKKITYYITGATKSEFLVRLMIDVDSIRRSVIRKWEKEWSKAAIIRAIHEATHLSEEHKNMISSNEGVLFILEDNKLSRVIL